MGGKLNWAFFKKPQNLQVGKESSGKHINKLTGRDLEFMLCQDPAENNLHICVNTCDRQWGKKVKD